jgi:hypothetical protein
VWGHLGCVGFREVPAALVEAAPVAAGEMHGRWVASLDASFLHLTSTHARYLKHGFLEDLRGVEEPFWGQLSYLSSGAVNP